MTASIPSPFSSTARRPAPCAWRSPKISTRSTSRATIRPRRAETLSMPASPILQRRRCCLSTRTARLSMTAHSRSSRRAATPPSPSPRRSPIRSSLTRRATSSPAAKRSRPGRCWPAITTQRSFTTSSLRILPRRWACRTRRPPTGWICTMTASTAVPISSVRRTPSTRPAWTSPTWRTPTQTSMRAMAAT